MVFSHFFQAAIILKSLKNASINLHFFFLGCLQFLQELHKGTNQQELIQIAEYYFDGQGKALRPMVTMLMGKAINYHIHRENRLVDNEKRLKLKFIFNSRMNFWTKSRSEIEIPLFLTSHHLQPVHYIQNVLESSESQFNWPITPKGKNHLAPPLFHFTQTSIHISKRDQVLCSVMLSGALLTKKKTLRKSFSSLTLLYFNVGYVSRSYVLHRDWWTATWWL